MSKISTRLDKNSIVEQAKQRYENEQKNQLPTEIISLPSKGMIYPETSPLRTGKVEVRYMTAYDEDILTNVSYVREGIMFEKLLESIVVTECDIQDIASLDRDAILIQSRILAYGADYPVTITNPDTNVKHDVVINLSNLKHKKFNLIADKDGEFEFKTNSTKELNIKFKYNIKTTADTGIYSLLQKCITEINGNRNPEYINEFIRYKFLAKDSKQFRSYYFENIPGIDYSYEFEGENGGTFTTTFPVTADFFWV